MSGDGEENITYSYDLYDKDKQPSQNVDDYYLPQPKLHPIIGALTIDEINNSSLLKKRSIVGDKKREKLMKTRKLNTSQQRIKYFRDELEKMRISFFNDSITFVIDRVNIVQDTLNQISTTDRFDFHKELKIFFIDEVAQDAGGILREWISYLSKLLIISVLTKL